MSVDFENLSDERLQNLIDNYRRQGETGSSVFIDALSELEKRKGQGLDFEKSFAIIQQAAKDRRFVSYKELSDASNADWNKVHYAVGGHMWRLIEYAQHKGWPLLSAIVVNKPNVETGKMEPDTLKGFIAAAKELGHTVSDDEEFLKEQQERVFAWGQALGSETAPS